jgi:hypothetical protein
MTLRIEKRRSNKFNAKPQVVDGIRFDSTAEANRYLDLKLLERAGEIRNLKVHPSWEMRVNGIVIGKFTPDFWYFDTRPKHVESIVEDVKSPITAKLPDYRLRLKLWQALYPGITFKEVYK